MNTIGELIDDLLRIQNNLCTVYLHDACANTPGDRLAQFRASTINSRSIENLCLIVRNEVRNRISAVSKDLKIQMAKEGQTFLKEIWTRVEPLGIEQTSVFLPTEYIDNYPAA